MKAIFANDECKGAFFLTTLPDTMDTVIDNLSTSGINSFAQMEPKFLNISEKHHLDENESNAYYTATNRQQKGKGRAFNDKKKYKDRDTKPQNGTSFSKSAEPLECTYCKKRNFKATGHTYLNCIKLKAANEGKKKPPNALAANELQHESDNPFDNICFMAEEVCVTPAIDSALNASAPFLDLSLQATVSESVRSSGSPWIFDTGASSHMTGCIDDFMEIKKAKGNITVAGRTRLTLEGIGTVHLTARLPDGSTKNCILTNDLFSRQLNSTRLFSWTYVSRLGYLMEAKGNEIQVMNAHRETYLCARLRGNSFVCQLVEESAQFTSYEEFHNAIGHSNVTNSMAKRLYDDSELILTLPADFSCIKCIQAKSTHYVPKALPQKQSTKPFELVHTDLAGPFSMPSLGRNRYYISFIDDYTNMAWVYFMKLKSETIQQVQGFMAMVSNQFGTTVKRLRSNNGGEYNNRQMKALLRS